MSLPAGFRQELQSRGSEPPVLTNAHQCLDLFPFADWETFEKRIVDISSVDPEAQAYARMLISGATPCPIDKQGRIVVPPHLRDHAALAREVTVAGVGPKIELWDRSRFQENLTQTNARYPEMARSVAEKLGI